MRAIGHPKDFVHYYKRKCTLDDIVVPATTTDPVVGAYAFDLTNVPNYTDFVNLYDQYKIKAVKMSFIPVSNVVATVTPGGATQGNAGTYFSNRMFTAIDYTQATAPANTDELREYANCKWSPYNRIHKRYFKPQSSINDGAGEAIQWPAKAQVWVPTAGAANATYVGLRYAMDAITGVTPVAGQVLYKVECTYYMAFKCPR